MSDIPQRERLPPDQRPTAAQLALQSRGGPMQIGGRPADACPYCGCAMFSNGTQKTQHEVIRYVRCRNQACGRRFISSHPPAKLLREIE